MGQFISGGMEEAMLDAALHLKAGDLVAFPTETVYGLGADACNSQAVARIYSVKGRPSDHPLIVHIASRERLGDWTSEVPEYALKLARDFWPGPLTLVVKRSELAQDFITGGQDTVGVRVPNHIVALALLEAFERIGGKGVAAPSANRFGQVSPTTATAVTEELGEFLHRNDQIIDGGACTVGVESTIIDCTGRAPRLLRPGSITAAMIEESAGVKIEDSPSAITRVSGSLENHYAPTAAVFLDQTPRPGQGLIAMAQIETPIGVIRISSPVNADEFAHTLYSSLRQADSEGVSEIVVLQPAGDGIEVAIRDRLFRAARK